MSNKKWDGKSKGNKLGYQFFVSTIKLFGLPFTYLFLRLVTYYYYLFSPTKKYLLQFYTQALGFTKTQSEKIARKNYYIFGQTLVDRFAFLIGKASKYTHNSTGGENIKKLIENGKGGVLLSAHIGNWELAGNIMKSNYNAKINVLMYQAEAEKLADFFNQVTGGVSFNIIGIKDDLSHIIQIHKALSNNELICIHSDRNMPNAKTLTTNFLGKKAKFPLGPFQLVSKFKAPVCFVYNIKTDKYHYELSCSEPISDIKSPEDILNKYVKSIENKVKNHPEQWFNFYDFFT